MDFFEWEVEDAPDDGQGLFDAMGEGGAAGLEIGAGVGAKRAERASEGDVVLDQAERGVQWS